MKKNKGKYYAINNLKDAEEPVFIAEVIETDNNGNIKYYAILQNGAQYEISQTSDFTFNLIISEEEQYTLQSEEYRICR